jgi:hypothetical protein
VVLHIRRETASVVGASAGVLLGLLTGCVGPQPTSQPAGLATASPEMQKIMKMVDPEVLGVAALYDSFDPWLWTEDRGRARGVVIRALYLEGRKYKGVFGDGVIRPKLYVQMRDERGAARWQVAKEWSFTLAEALPFRSKRETMLGYGYRFHLPWGDDLDLTGREIRMVVEFERKDGRVVASDKKDFRVPGAPPTGSRPS